MEIQKTIWDKGTLPADVVLTPDFVSKFIVNFINPKGKCLDPCRGKGAFYKFLPTGSDYSQLLPPRHTKSVLEIIALYKKKITEL